MDAVYAAFLGASEDGRRICSEAEWRKFVEMLRSDGVVQSTNEVSRLEDLWSRMLELEEEERITYKTLRRHMVALFAEKDDKENEATMALELVRAGSCQLRAFDGQTPKSLRQLLERCDFVASQTQNCALELAQSCAKANRRLEIDRLESLVNRFNGETRDVPVDPIQWQRDHIIDVEKQANMKRVAHRRHLKINKNKKGIDPFSLAQGFAALEEGCGVEVHEAMAACADGREREAFVVDILAPDDLGRKASKFAAAARSAAWRSYAAHRSLSVAVRSVPRALAWFDAHPDDKTKKQCTRLVFERPNVTESLTTALRRVDDSTEKLAPTAPLVRHWLREILCRAAEIDTMATYCIDNDDDDDAFGLSNLWIAEHGAVLRVGGLRWAEELREGPPQNRLPQLEARRAQLLKGFAAAADDLLTALCHTDHSVLRAILRCCRSYAAAAQQPSHDDDHLVQLTPSGLLAHAFFKPLSQDDLVKAMAAYERIFLKKNNNGREEGDTTTAHLLDLPPAPDPPSTKLCFSSRLIIHK